MKILEGIPAFIFIASILLSFYIGENVPPKWVVEQVTLDIQKDKDGKEYFVYKEKPKYLKSTKNITESPLSPDSLSAAINAGRDPSVEEDFVYQVPPEVSPEDLSQRTYYQLIAEKHFGFWSLLPAFVAILLCWQTREPISALFAGVVSGALILRQYDITEKVLIPNLSTESAAGILILYLWLLGGLLGIWSRTGASKAFAEMMTKHFVKGPRSAKVISWLLGVVFFQGGTVSTVLVGTTVKPIADKQRVSHEELSYIVDSTASPVASLLAFNAWPGYVQAFIFVAGVPFLLTEGDRIAFFFKSIPFCFYAILAIAGTFFLSIEKPMFLGKKMRSAINRARTTGELDAPDSHPLSAKELHMEKIPAGYKHNVLEFFIPLALIIIIAIGTFISSGSPQIRLAFGVALLVAIFTALIRGMRITDAMTGVVDGLKGVVGGSVILMLAIVIGAISRETGGGTYLVELLGSSLPFWILPVLLQLITMTVSFSTGTSWGTYAVAFPLAMPLAWAVANAQGVAHPELYMMICFAAVMDGSVYGDQCSPISDTTVLSSMCTGTDLMDHVKTQIPQATFAAGIAAVLWTAVTILFV